MGHPTLQTLQIALLGNFRLTYDARPVTGVNSERLQSLLAYLVLHRHSPQPRQRLAFYFWPDSGEAQARTNLRRELHHLRQALPDADRFLQTDAKTIQWRMDAPFTLDIADFELAIAQAEEAERRSDRAGVRAALEKAAQLYQGDLLPSCYDDWVEPVREQLQQTCIRVLEQLIRQLEEQQDYCVAIRYAQQLLRINSLHEATYCSLMRLHALNSDRASALRVYQQCIDVLQRELDVEPSRTTREVYEGVLTNQPFPSLVKPSQELSFAVPKAPSPLTRSLIGREQEWATITAWMAGTNPSPSSILLLTGEPGIGKTRLLEEIAAKIQSSHGCVLWGRGFEAEMVRPYGVWIDAFRSIASKQAALPAKLGALLPELGTASNEFKDRSQLFDAAVQFLSQLAAKSKRVAIILDDIQWLDEASTALLHYCVRLVSNASVLWACAARNKELDDNLPVCKWVQTLRREKRLQAIALSPLNQTQTAELIRSVSSDIDSDRIFADSGGNPLFALEIARATSREEMANSDDIEALIQTRLQQLDDTARELIPWAAALGRSFSPTVVAQLADCSLNKLLVAMEQLEQHSIIRPGGVLYGEVGYDFAHDIVRQVAYNQLTEPRRRLMHRQIAQVLNNCSSSDRILVSDVAHHASLGGDRLLAASACLSAAEQCLKLFAYAEASELAQRGMQHCQYLDDKQRIRRHLELLKVFIYAGVRRDRIPEVENELHQRIAEANRLNLKDEEAIGLEALIALNYDRGNFSGVHQHSLRAAEAGRAASPTTTARMLAYTGSCLAEIEREMPRAQALLLEAKSLAERVGLELADIFLGLGWVYHYRADFDAAQQLLTQGWKIAQAEQDHWRECTALKCLAMLELEAGKPTKALPYCHEMHAVAAKMSGEGSEKPFAIALEALARYQLQQVGAEDALEQALVTLRQIDAKRMLAYILIGAAQLDLDSGQIELASSRAQEALRMAQPIHHPSEIALAWTIAIQSTWASGEHQQALEQLRELQRNIDEHNLSDRAQKAIRKLAQILEC
jgi:DNA-binding SARP family transcriptional activator/nucleoside-triphosphatase THEP1